MNSEYIDYKHYFDVIINKKRIIGLVTVISLMIGVIYALVSPIEYESRTVLLPERPSGKMGGASSLLKSFGLGGAIPGASSEVPYFDPFYFENIVKSNNYYDYILKTMIRTQESDSVMTYADYFLSYQKPEFLGTLKEYTVGLPLKIMKSFRKNPSSNKKLASTEYFNFTIEQHLIIEGISDRISLEIDSDNGLITITTKMPDPLSAISLCNNVRDYLMEFSENYSTAKLTNEVKYLKAQLSNAKSNYEQATLKLADFTDKNQSITKAKIRIQEEKLRNDLNIVFNVYNILAQQFEETKLNLEKKRPAFTVVSLPSYPNYKSEPKRKILYYFLRH